MQRLGFFSPEENLIIRGDEKPKKKTSSFSGKALRCEDCGLYKNCHSPKIPLYGYGHRRIMIVAEAPGKNEDLNNEPLVDVGRSGHVVRQALRESGFVVERDVWITNAVRCRPLDNKTPSIKQIEACHRFLTRDIDRCKPNVIIVMGEVAMQSVIGHRITGRASNAKWSSWVGEIIPDQELKIWVAPIFHPSYVLRKTEDFENPDESALGKLWVEQFKKALSYADTPVPDNGWMLENYELITRPEIAVDRIEDLLSRSEQFAFDYETTGLKPYRDGHEILSASISNGEVSVSFPFFDNQHFRATWNSFLTDRNIVRIAHNSPFEVLWSKVKSNVWIPTISDSMTRAHILHNKKSVNLKFLAYCRFGLIGYDDLAERFLKPTKEESDKFGANAFNQMRMMPRDQLLEYNADDSMLEYHLFDAITNDMTETQLRTAEELYEEGQVELTRTTDFGFEVDVESIELQNAAAEIKLQEAKKSILVCREMKLWDRDYPYDPNKDAHNRYILLDKLGCRSFKKTKKGNVSIDAEVLEDINSPFANRLLEYKRWAKVLSTYIRQFDVETWDRVIHAFFNLGYVKTFRSASSNINFQNQPKRDKEIMKIIRSLIIPRVGHLFLGYDYKSIEVITAGLVTGDMTLLNYTQDKSTDMHRDSAMDIFFMSREEVEESKKTGHILGDGVDWRFIAKNYFVFAEFYGDWFGSIGPKIWREIKKYPEMLSRMLRNNIRNEKDFVEHLKAVEDIFWNKRFWQYTEWKKEQWKMYEKIGYIESKTGFIYKGPMSKNEIINYQIQGPAFQILLWSFIHVAKELRSLHITESFPFGEIHDQSLFDSHPDHEPIIDNLVYRFGTQEVRDYWKWITVPLEIEKEKSGLRGTPTGSWAGMESCGYLRPVA